MTGSDAVRWTWVFLDTPGAAAERSWAFWSRVTGAPVTDRRGDHGEFATLAPVRGQAWVTLQAVLADPVGRVYCLTDRKPLPDASERPSRGEPQV